MSFVLDKNGSGFSYPVSIPVILESGATKIQKLEMIFKRLSREEISELQNRSRELADSEISTDSIASDVEFILDVAEGWKNVIDADKSEVVFSRENVRSLLNTFPNAATEIVKAFFESTLGGGAKRKN